ncbi:MAG: radical SAM protein [Candidatus Nezhaarchaeota archaeon]|nr:radical SAM protein [Candidatus Nezhaarchaeota archaeon]
MEGEATKGRCLVKLEGARYPRFLTPSSEPFNPLELMRATEAIVCRPGPEGLERKYTAFYATGVYGGIATGYAVGCSLRCFFCWSELSRDFPELRGEFYSPAAAYRKLDEAAKKYRVKKLRLSGAEPLLGVEHTIALLEYVEASSYSLFILETNGIALGASKELAERLARFSKIHVRVSLKAAGPQEFQRRTGARGEFYELPFKAIEHLLDSGVSFHVAAMSDPRIMSRGERIALIERLRDIDPRAAANLEEEVCDPYDSTLIRMAAYGIDPVEFFTRGGAWRRG